MSYPRTRLRRLRSDDFIRRLTAETRLSVDDFVYPLFVHEHSRSEAVASMPDVRRLCLDDLWREAERAARLGLPAVAVFAAAADDKKTADGREAFNDKGLAARAVSGIKSRLPHLGVAADVALDSYTTHGHDGITDDKGRVQNDATIAVLRRQSLVLAAAGADIVAPSDMMDGRIGAIRDALESEKYSEVKILSYAAKYASAFYGPFRDALGSAKNLDKADKRAYQMDAANRREAMREMRLDLEEGADMLMVKPALPYLDVLRDAARTFEAPVLAYQVSGEYAMLKSAAAAGMDEDSCIWESLLAIKRAGARAIFTYFAPWAAERLGR